MGRKRLEIRIVLVKEIKDVAAEIKGLKIIKEMEE